MRNQRFVVFRRPAPEGGKWAVHPSKIVAMWEAPPLDKQSVTHLYLTDCLIIEVVGNLREVEFKVNAAIDGTDEC